MSPPPPPPPVPGGGGGVVRWMDGWMDERQSHALFSTFQHRPDIHKMLVNSLLLIAMVRPTSLITVLLNVVLTSLARPSGRAYDINPRRNLLNLGCGASLFFSIFSFFSVSLFSMSFSNYPRNSMPSQA